MQRQVVYNKILILILCTWFLSFRWPVNNGRITSTFGESRGDHFHDGMDLISTDKKVYPIDDGKVLYAWSKKMFPLEEYTGSGNFIIVSHKDNLCSTYLHLEDFDLLNNNIGVSKSIGNFANTGRSYGAHIHFTVFNLETFESINALNYSSGLEDRIKPAIGNIALKINGKFMILSDSPSIRLTEKYPMLVKIHDSIKPGDNHGVYRIKAEVNGKKIMDVTFDRLRFSKNGLTFDSKSFHHLYEGNYYKIDNIDYKQGINILKVYAYDYSGNFSEKEFKLDIFLDM